MNWNLLEILQLYQILRKNDYFNHKARFWIKIQQLNFNQLNLWKNILLIKFIRTAHKIISKLIIFSINLVFKILKFIKQNLTKYKN